MPKDYTQRRNERWETMFPGIGLESILGRILRIARYHNHKSTETMKPFGIKNGEADVLSALLHARGDRIVRVKGVIAAPAGRLLLQGVRREVQRPEIMPASGQPDARDNLLVLIGRGYAPADLARSLAGFTRMRPPPTAPAITTK